MNIDNTYLTEEYLDSLGYYKIKDDGQYGVYNNKHWVVESRSYGKLGKDYRQLVFNRDDKYGIFLSITANWNTRKSLSNTLIQSKEEFELALKIAI
jgi:hypothetical protein